MRTPLKTFAAPAALALVAALGGLGLSVAAGAQARDPAYAAAKAAGQVGEKRDGYLGVVGTQGADIQALVRDINNKRRAVYTSKAASLSSTIDEYAFTTGCRLILETSSGEKYQGLDGSWKTRGAGAPERDAKCP
ncbi:YdbL family protein [Novosphingobium sp. 1949]|uniref:YdbL family protein n=1 Tax=Novosphingobium organovorum TaxID=2930092 RepID=A0ABT0B8N1_9SPHN|nr:YdbL family protein [Novosphingobium organovorum]MCJ2181358.1 YdbL family protein [Novosphingobium organovorum]